MLRSPPVLLLAFLATSNLSAQAAPAGVVPPLMGEASETIPRQVRVSIAPDKLFVSVRTEVTPEDVGERSWARWDRDQDGALSESELGPLSSELKRQETCTMGVSVDGEVLDVRRLGLRVDLPAERPLPLNARLVLRIEGNIRLDLAPGAHLVVVYDQPRSPDGVVPFRLGFGRGLKATGGGGARGELRNGGQRIEVATTKGAPLFWGSFVRENEASPPPVTPSP